MLFEKGTLIGLKDINGIPVVVGDRISFSIFPNEELKGTINYDEENACFCVIRDTGEKNTFFVVRNFKKE